MGSAAPPPTIRVAVTQHEPAWLDLRGGVAKTISIIKQAASEGAKLLAFPEVWIPGYPAWIWSRPIDFDLGVEYVQNSLKVESPEMQAICAAAGEHGVNVVLGFSEREGESVYIAQALIDDQGKLRMTRRKMKPTHQERTIFGDASGTCLAKVIDLPDVGRVGGLSCWEHIQPLLKFYTFSQGEQIHVAAWPPLDPFINGSPGFYSMTIEGTVALPRQRTVICIHTYLDRLPQSLPIVRNRISSFCPALHKRTHRSWHQKDGNDRHAPHGCTHHR